MPLEHDRENNIGPGFLKWTPAVIFLQKLRAMNLRVTRILSLALLSLFGITEARAQFDRWPAAIKNIEIGYGSAKTWADYDRQVKAVREDGKLYDTTISMSVTSKGGFSGAFGTSLPLTRLGRASRLNLGLNFIYNTYLWDYPTANSARLTDSGIRYDYSGNILFSGASLNYGLAISADFKFGVDAMMDKRYRWSWTGGIGVLPSMNLTSDFGSADANFGVQPFAKTEVGLRAGIVWKLRVMYQAGTLKYLDVKPKDSFFGIPNAEQTTRLTGKGNLSISLILMPFSWTYTRSSWYNSY